MPETESSYARHSRPALMRLLRSLKLDRVYHRGEGDTLYTTDDAGEEVAVLDLVGGFGAGFVGHNHSEVVDEARRVLEEKAPFNAQGSERAAAGRLCRRLSAIVGERTGSEYIVTLANTGTEAVEAAIKHAESESSDRIGAILTGFRRRFRNISQRFRNRECRVAPTVLDTIGERLDLPTGQDLDIEEAFSHVLHHALRTFEAEPIFLAMRGAFHGKSTGSVKLTHFSDYRLPFERIGLKTVFLPPGDEEALEQVIEEQTLRYLTLTVDRDGRVGVSEEKYVNISGVFVEPILGEGGVREVGAEYLEALRDAADRGEFPLIIDEIQTGCGRTGTFLASEQDGVVGDYYVLSKSLGGGLAKVAALLVDRDRYLEEFGVIHTSTFAEDDFSSRVALSALEIITRDDGATMDRAREMGRELTQRLESLQAAHPDVIADVRGRGLMVGVEFVPQNRSTSHTIRLISRQGYLGYLVASYLLNRKGIRVAPTISNPETIRIQPSAFIETSAFDRLVAALAELCRLLAEGRSAALIPHLLEEEPGPEPVELPTVRDEEPPPYAARVAFVGHFLHRADLRHWDPSLGDCSDAAIGRFLDRTHRVLDPYLSERVNIQSVTGEVANLTFIGVPITPAQIQQAFGEGDVRWIEKKVEAAVDLARRQGARVVGLGGFTSILTGQGTRIVEDRVALTSGNAMTVAMGVAALERTADEMGIDLETAHLGAVGATGNICSLLVQLMADRVQSVTLIGPPRSERRLRNVGGEVYFELFKLLRKHGEACGGIAGILRETETHRRIAGSRETVDRIGLAIWDGLQKELGDDAPIRFTSEMEALESCNLIVTASSAPDPIIHSKHIGSQPIAICDIALPGDTSPEVAARDNVRVVRGGIVAVPRNPDLRIGGVCLEPGTVYACMAETLLLGLTGIGEHFSYGRIKRMHVDKIIELASFHGFELARPTGDFVL